MSPAPEQSACLSCAEPTPVSGRFCVRCGAALRHGDGVADRQHHATVVVSDLQGSTALAERLDPESLRLVLDQYFDELGRVLESHGGRIEKRIGDAMVTVFGVPVARDDDATRAARAVAESQSSLASLNERLERVWGVRLTNRTGVSTGPVTITDAGGGHRVLSGSALDLAMALEPVAPPFEALLATETVAELQATVSFDEPVEYALKSGRTATAHRLIAVTGDGVIADDSIVVDATNGVSGCPSCGTPLVEGLDPPPAWCAECGTRFSTGGHVQSRRTLTIIFADMRAVGVDDATIARQGVVRCFDEARAVLERHGAVVEKFIGDAVMAVFGLDRRREDDALRAVRAGLEMQQGIAAVNADLEQTLGVRIDVRIGINTGPVIAGDPALGQRLVTGDAVNVAARLEQAARPGDVLVGALTRRLCGAGVLAEEVPPLPLKGKAQLVAAWRVIEAVSANRASIGSSVPMIGRAAELARLARELPLAAAAMRLRRVDVSGEAGSGKSRLVNEFVHEASLRARVIRTQCLPYGEGITFWPIVDAIGQLSGAETSDDRAAALQKLGEVTDDPDVTVRLGSLLGLVDDPFPLSELFWAVRRLFERVGAARPLVLVIDGLHWAEPTLLELLDHLATNVAGSAVLLVTTTRPDDDYGEGGPEGDSPEVAPQDEGGPTRIELGPLGDADVERLLRLNLGGDLPAPVREQVVRVSAGNPLFVEQLAIMLVENGRLERRGDAWAIAGGVEHLEVPPTIEALLAARIDALAPDERATLEPASIVGREFPQAAVIVLVERLAEDGVARALADLGRRRLVVPARDPDVFVDHRFANLMIRDVVYAGLLKRTRASWHEGFAAWLEEVLGSRVGEYAEVIGYHLEQSFHYQRQLGVQGEAVADVGQRAFRCLAPAGERAFVRGDMPAASNLLSRAASVMAATASERNRVLIRAGEARMQTGRFAEAVAHFNDAETGAQAAGDTVTAAAAELARGTLRFQTGDGVDDVAARQLFERLQPLFAASGDHASDARCWRLLAYVELTSSQWGAAERAMTALIDRARLAGDTVLELRVLPGLVGFALHGPTPVRQGIAKAMELIEATAGDRRARALTERYLGHLLALDGRGEEGRALCTQARESLVELGWNFEAALVSIDLGPVELTLGRPEEAERVLRADYDSLRSMGEQNYVSTTAALLGEAVRRQGRLDEALELTEFAAGSTSPADVLTQAVWREVRASALAGLGRLDEAETLAREALTLVLDTDGLSSHGDAYITLAEVFELRARWDDARMAAAQAAVCFEAKGHRPGQLRTAALLARVGASESVLG